MTIILQRKPGLDTLPVEILTIIGKYLQNDTKSCIDMPFRIAEYDAEPIADAWREWQEIERSYNLLNFIQTCSSIRQSTIHLLWHKINLSRLFMVEFIFSFIQKFIRSKSNHPCLNGIVKQVLFSEYRISPFPFWWQRRSHIKLGGYYRKLPIGLYVREKSRHQIAKVDCISTIQNLQEKIIFIIHSTKAKQFHIHKYVYLPEFDHSKLIRLNKSGVLVMHPDFENNVYPSRT